jgi:NADPH:quinone reductase-like Zn-dependent oxidoreductase
MKAIVCTQYGSPDVLQLREVEKPTPKDNEVLIRIHATTVGPADCAFLKGDPFIVRIMYGLTKPKFDILGTELAGEIEAVGKDVSAFKAGDQVFGQSPDTFGAHAEYLCLPEDAPLAVKSPDMTYEEAVATSDGGLTALPFLRDGGHIQSGHKVLINGASGSLGTAGVQLARHFGADVTGVCGPTNVEMVRSLGADRVIDYTEEDFTQSDQTYDIIFDAVGKSSFSSCSGVLKPGGIYLTTVPTLAILPQMLWTSKIGSKRARIMFAGLRPSPAKRKDLLILRELFEAGETKPVIDRRYPLAQVAEAYRYVETGHKKGNVVITVGPTGK